jgi:hypothetical protein
VGVAQLVERQTVDLDVAGSNPVTHPNFFNNSSPTASTSAAGRYSQSEARGHSAPCLSSRQCGREERCFNLNHPTVRDEFAINWPCLGVALYLNRKERFEHAAVGCATLDVAASHHSATCRQFPGRA